MIDILKNFNTESKYAQLIDSLLKGKNCSCFGLTFNEISFLASGIKKQKILVAVSNQQALNYSSQLESLGLKTFVLQSKIENYTYSYFDDPDSMQNLSLALFKLLKQEIDVLIVLDKVLVQKVINPKIFLKNILTLEVNKETDFETFLQNLIMAGYKKVDEITKSGEFCVRGDLVSVFAINQNYPIRISFFDSLVEKISQFSLNTYETLKEESKISICPCNFYFSSEKVEEKVFDEILKETKKSKNNDQILGLTKLKAELENRTSRQINSNFILPFLDGFDSSIFDYLIDGVEIFLEPKLIFDNLSSEYVNIISTTNSLIFEGRLLESHKNCFVKKEDLFASINTKLAFLNLNTSNRIFESNEVYSFLSSFVKNYNNNFNLLLEDIRSFVGQNFNVVLCADSNEKAVYLNNFLTENSVFSSIITNKNQIKEKKVYIFVSSILNGANFVEDKFVVLGNYNIYGTKKVEETSNKIKKVFFTPKVGDYVVHDTFGICLCKETQKIEFNGALKDYFVLEFFGGDLLYLPSEKANLISKYVGETETPKLNKLGTDEFNKEKEKVKAKVKTLAFDLIELYAKRSKIKGFVYAKDDIVQQEFENAFPFPLTIDQEKAVCEIKKDMESEKVMDRLVCGDVGYGKTEVAMRAIFKAILSGKQVAFLCPTTILCQQHYKTCLARMQNFMVNVQSLSRFNTSKETKKILEELKNGKINLICGTHRLLSKDVEFNNLGLLVLDEEQRFGVSDKEKIKNLKQNIDVLTLSATPIPRTLNMSLIGVRDISIIDTPPKNRIPVQSIVTEYSPSLIKDAIQKELNRNGQVLIVYNRVETINQFAKTISDYFPDVNIGVAHGQMDKKQLENVIIKVYNQEISILVSTVLIENGIDLPLANTIIVINSDKLGLSQLYQLRGRVGRSDREAFAYFTYQSNQALTEVGYKRLACLSEFGGLGGGFKIAMRDLEIRGAGSIFGAEQSGHIEKVGIDMYNRLLKEAVDELKGAKFKEVKDLKLDVNLDCFIPKNYIENEESRFEIYEQISKLKNLKEKDELEMLLQKKFGEVPSEITNLMFVGVLKNVMQNYNAKRVVINNEKCFIEFYDKASIDNEEVLNLISKNKRLISLKIKTLPIIELNFSGKILDKIKQVINIFIKS